MSNDLIPAIRSSTFYLANLYITSAFSPSASAAMASASDGVGEAAPGANPAPVELVPLAVAVTFVAFLVAVLVEFAGAELFPLAVVFEATLLELAGAGDPF